MERLIREPECRSITGLSRTTRWELERKGKFPNRQQIIGRTVGWPEAEIRRWVEARMQGRSWEPSRPAADAASETRASGVAIPLVESGPRDTR